MNKELEAQLIPILETTNEGLAAAVELLKEQAPLLVNELLRWTAIYSFAWWFLGVFILIATLSTRSRMYQLAKVYDSKIEALDAEIRVVTCGIQAILIVIGLGLSLGNFTWLKVLVAPRLVLLEYITRHLN